MNAKNDTIAAIATAPGPAGISVIRVSGPAALEMADTLFRCQAPVPSMRATGTFVYGHVQSGNQDLDEAILLIYRAPASYTREDVIEIQGHGGSATARRILHAVLAAGARLAQPGEFTQRAFLSGRIDLLQAEAVMDLIQAQSEKAAAAALEQLEGTLSSVFNRQYDQLLEIAAYLEAYLDFDEEEFAELNLQPVCDKLEQVKRDLKHLAEGWQEGHRLREGALVVIAGRPNVGKSTLMNALLDKPRAIVTDTPGTTRDTLEEHLVINGYPIRLVDTAGIRDSDCQIEQEGIRRACSLINKSDINILLLDASIFTDALDSDLITRSSPEKTIIVLNKIDKGQVVEKELFKDFQVVRCSLLNGVGLQELKQTMITRLHFKTHTTAGAQAYISERHLQIINQVIHSIEAACLKLSTDEESKETLGAFELQEAIQQLGLVTGRTYHSELLNSIFSRFCVGK